MKHFRTLLGFTIGVLVTILVIHSIEPLHAALRSRRIEVHTGVTVYVDGTRFEPRDAYGNVIESFIFEGNLYVPSEELARVLGMEVCWDGATHTLRLGGDRVRPPVEAQVQPTRIYDLELTISSALMRAISEGVLIIDGQGIASVRYDRGRSVVAIRYPSPTPLHPIASSQDDVFIIYHDEPFLIMRGRVPMIELDYFNENILPSIVEAIEAWRTPTH